jgi:hypothetical protein
MAETRALAARLAKCEADLKTVSQLVIADDGMLMQMTPGGEARCLGRVKGADGVSVIGAKVVDEQLLIALSDGKELVAGKVKGERGPEGFSLTDFDTDWRPEDKVLVLRWDAGETSYSHELFVPYVRDMGVWGEGRSYLKGDGVTWGGSFWIAQDDTADKPEASAKSWRLAVKRGRDGKDFAGPQPAAPPKVKVP